MAEGNKTLYNKLNRAFNLDGTGYQDSKPPEDKKIIIRGSSPEELKRKKLELLQKQELYDKLNKTIDHGFQKAMQFEAARLPAYLDYEGMEFYPIIASALDLLSEEATTIGANGNMLNIYSDKSRIKAHLEELFYNVINVNVNLPFWARKLCKYGDNFVYMYGEKGKGISVVKQLVNYEIERLERVKDGKAKVVFKQRETGDEFNIFEIAHFRLLGDDKYMPYGSSVLNKVRRVFRQLIMAEDAMVTYRIIRAGEKRIFKIDVGNIDEDDIESYMHKVASKFKKTQQVYPDSGQIDYRFNMLGNDEDYFIPVRNANVQTGIDTLPGASNLDDIQDIGYLRDNLFTGLGIPKPFLGFQESAGEGKNLAQMDIRFAKKINRIQQALIQELNKIAIIHLMYLGFDLEDASNFTLSLTNPSTQQELLQTELLQNKASVYSEITRSEGGSIAAMSHTTAKKLLFNMSDSEIIEDLQRQKIERSISQELQDSPQVIRNTGVFKEIDDKYGTGEEMPIEGGEREEGEGVDEPNRPPEEGADNAVDSPDELPQVLGQGKGFKEKGFDMLIDHIKRESKEKSSDVEEKKLIGENKQRNEKLNKNAFEMVKEIDEMIKDVDDNESLTKNLELPETLFYETKKSREKINKIIEDEKSESEKDKLDEIDDIDNIVSPIILDKEPKKKD